MCISHSVCGLYLASMWCNGVIRKIGTRSSRIRRPSCVSSLDCTVGSPLAHAANSMRMYTHNHTQILVLYCTYVQSHTIWSCTVHTYNHTQFGLVLYIRTITHNLVLYCMYVQPHTIWSCTVHTIVHKYVMYCHTQIRIVLYIQPHTITSCTVHPTHTNALCAVHKSIYSNKVGLYILVIFTRHIT